MITAPAIFAAFFASLALVWVYLYLYVAVRERHLGYWALSWFCIALRYFWEGIDQADQDVDALPSAAAQIFSLLGGIALLWGTLLWEHRKIGKRWLLLGVVVALWIGIAAIWEIPFLWKTMPSFFFIAVVMAWTGVQFLSLAKRVGLEAHLVGWGLIVWALHKADYPFLRETEFGQWGYFIAAGLGFFVANSMLLLYFKAGQLELEGARSDILELNSQLERTVDERTSQLRSSESQFRAIYEGSHVSIAIVDVKTQKILECNAATLAMLGYDDSKEIIGVATEKFSALEQEGGASAKELAKTYIEKVAEEGSATFEWTSRRKDGSYFPVEVLLSYIEREEGDIVQAISYDVSDRHRREELLLLEGRVTRLFLDDQVGEAIEGALSEIGKRLKADRCGFYEYAEGGGAVHCRDEWCAESVEPIMDRGELIATSRHAWCHERLLRGKACVIHSVDALPEAARTTRDEFQELGVKSFLAVPVIQNEVVMGLLSASVLRERKWLDVEVDTFRLVGEILAMGRKRQRVERELVLAKESAETANRAKDDFLAEMSHEIRTPMNSIVGMTEYTLSHNLNPEDRYSLNIVLESAEALQTMLSQVLDYSRIQLGKVLLVEAWFNLHHLIENVIASREYEAQQKGLELRHQIEEGVPQFVLGDAVKIRQILLNLTVNAIKYTTRGSVSVEVTASPREGNKSRVSICVSDTGPGIPEDKQRVIFEAFEQTDSANEGAGLGLTISTQIVEAMEGKIWLESVVGEGSRFHVLLPLEVDPSRESVEARSDVPEKPFLAKSPVSLNVLVADDSETNRVLMQLLLKNMGHRVTMASDGQEALDILGRADFDLLLVDVQMPRLSGLEVMKVIREKESGGDASLPIIAVTALARKEDQTRCLAAGADKYLAKPIKHNDLFQAIAQLVPECGTGSGIVSEDSIGEGRKRRRGIKSVLLRLKGDMELLEQLFELFRSESEEWIPKIVEAAKNRDAKGIQFAAHRLVSLAGNFEGREAVELASRLELKARSGDLDDAEIDVEELKREFERLKEELERAI